jgi:hypothetical protein
MDHFLRVLNSWNFLAWREDVFCPLRPSGKPSAEELGRIRVWIREALKPSSQIAQLYRVLEVDFDDDILRAAPAFLPSKHLGVQDSRYAFRMFWRILFRRCAVHHAWRLGCFLRHNESFCWRIWRLKEYLMPRLLVGVLLGFFILLASSGLIGILEHMQYDPMWYFVPIFFALFVLLLATANVQRQIGRSSVWVAYGLLYAAVGGLIHYWGGQRLCYRVTYRFVVLCASAAMFLGFVFQLFWQEASFGDPL